MLPNTAVRQENKNADEKVFLLHCHSSEIYNMTCQICPSILCKVHLQAVSPFAVAGGWATSSWTCQGVWGSAEAVHYLRLKAMPFNADRSLDSIALSWLLVASLLAVFIHRDDLLRFRYSSAHLRVIIHPLSPSWAQNLTRTQSHMEVSGFETKKVWRLGEKIV